MPPSTPDSARRFSSRVEDYARFRPGYPGELLELLRREIGLRPSHHVADVGSGTGLLTALFLEHGNPVHAVEPNPEMRAVAEDQLGRHPVFTSVDGSAEETGLPDGSVDLVAAGQAFHWFDREEARREFTRILRPGGWGLVVWYTRRTDVDPFHRELERLLLEHGTDYRSVRHDRIEVDTLREFFAADYGNATLEHVQVLDRNGLRGRLRSMSYVPEPGEEGHASLMDAADELLRRHADEGRLRLQYTLEIHWGRMQEGG